MPTPAEWKLPLYESPSVKAKSAGALIARVMPGEGMEFTFRPPSGEDVKFDPDWVLPDWGYTFMMDHTVLDRKGDWFQLPPRPFRDAVWIHLPGRAGPSPQMRWVSETSTRCRRPSRYVPTGWRARPCSAQAPTSLW